VSGTAWERLRRIDPRVWDAVLAAALVAGSVLSFAVRARSRHELPDLAGFALIVIGGGSLAWRRRAPLTVFAIVGAVVATASLFGNWPESALLLWTATYSAAAYSERDRLLPVLIPVAVAGSVAISVGERFDRGLNWVTIASELFLTFGIPALLGRMTFNRRRRIVLDRELSAREAVVAERARIARELHDVVAHHMSVMVVQAAAARAVGERDRAAAAQALERVEESGRAGLAEMRRLLGLLDADDRAEREPQPGMARLDDLLQSMRATGLSVEAVVEGTPRPLPPGVDLSAYRVVQEALTNSMKHASGASARVLLRYEADALELEVADDGPGPFGEVEATGGRGLIGMRERVQLCGGEFEAGPNNGGGFVVRARLPADAETPA